MTDQFPTSPQTPLLPCPFCKKAVQFRKALHISDGNTDAIIHAESSDCGMIEFNDESVDESIIAKWNTRASLSAPEREALEALKVWHKFQSMQNTTTLYNAASRLVGSTFNPAEYDDVE